jgi:hypothetical protein
MKCKNIECENETIGKRVYCSLTCRNIFVNKYLRNYEKCSNTYLQKRKESKEIYLKNPKYCKSCSEIIPFEKKINDYCNHSCKASFINKGRLVTWGDKISKGVKNYIIENGLFGALLVIKDKIPLKSCKQCLEEFSKKTKFCSNKCRREFDKENTDKYQQYRILSNFKFSLNDYPNEFDFTLVEKYGWYSPSNKKNNLGGISRDHMFSVREGFEQNIDPNIISHPANCRLMIHSENISKNKKSILTIEELLNRIKKFEEKYEKI